MRKYITTVLIVMLALLVVIGVTGCGSTDEAADTADDAATDVAAGDVADEPEGETPERERTGEPGSPTNPLPLGTVATIGDYEVAITAVTKNANDDIAEANALNSPPIDGSQFVLAAIEAKYVGTAQGVIWSDINYRYYGADGETYDSGMAESPNSLYKVPEPMPGESISGDMAFQVPVGQIEGGSIVVWDWDDETETHWDIQ